MASVLVIAVFVSVLSSAPCFADTLGHGAPASPPNAQDTPPNVVPDVPNDEFIKVIQTADPEMLKTRVEDAKEIARLAGVPFSDELLKQSFEFWNKRGMMSADPTVTQKDVSDYIREVLKANPTPDKIQKGMEFVETKKILNAAPIVDPTAPQAQILPTAAQIPSLFPMPMAPITNSYPDMAPGTNYQSGGGNKAASFFQQSTSSDWVNSPSALSKLTWNPIRSTPETPKPVTMRTAAKKNTLLPDSLGSLGQDKPANPMPSGASVADGSLPEGARPNPQAAVRANAGISAPTTALSAAALLNNLGKPVAARGQDNGVKNRFPMGGVFIGNSLIAPASGDSDTPSDLLGKLADKAGDREGATKKQMLRTTAYGESSGAVVRNLSSTGSSGSTGSGYDSSSGSGNISKLSDKFGPLASRIKGVWNQARETQSVPMVELAQAGGIDAEKLESLENVSARAQTEVATGLAFAGGFGLPLLIAALRFRRRRHH